MYIMKQLIKYKHPQSLIIGNTNTTINLNDFQ